jgi:LPS export ABC transporter protein LptC
MMGKRNFYSKFKKLDKRRRLYVILCLVVIFIMLWAFISAGIITSNFNRKQVNNKQDQQKVDAAGIIITETKQGRKYFEIYGENGNYSNDHSVATLNNVVGNFYKDGEVSMSFQSSKGTYDEKAKVITLYDNTYIVLEDGVSLNADKLTWQGSDKDTIAEGHVRIRKNKEMQSIAEKGIIGPDYKTFRIVGKTQTKVWTKGK